MSRTSIQNATDRLRVLVLDTAPGAIEVRTLKYAEADAITEVLDELHRLHKVVSDQQSHIAAQAQLIASRRVPQKGKKQ